MDIPRRKCMCRSWCDKCYKLAHKPQYCDICTFAVREVHQVEASRSKEEEAVDAATNSRDPAEDKPDCTSSCSPRVLKGRCTGFAWPRKGICAQTVDMSCDTYNHGRDDACYLLHLPTGQHDWALVYDVGCIASPIGINSRGVAMSLYNLYNTAGHGYERVFTSCSEKSDAAPMVLPMAVLQWAVLLGELDTIVKIESMLRRAVGGIGLFTSAALLITCSNDPDMALEAEMAGEDIWTREVRTEDEDFLLRANHSQPTSLIRSTEDIPKDVNESSHVRLAKLNEIIAVAREGSVVQPSHDGKESSSMDEAGNMVAREVLSHEPIQEDDTLATVILQPKEGVMDIRFKLGTRIKVTIKRGLWLRFGGYALCDDNNNTESH
ncbi:hypothetical protein Pmar_PMAR014798 [Perkinsus marinus ATCC 50983]|uniref:Uncharacterized protein n=1 Tax=Perkinsus marinus (strain ATCC 50983 / TXsc) TaxID=423536 RepID=C5LSZ4_PERM5|nr:hypothetical protein Pmar_PMAR014798 [Perkinsus marinus ATCC 50983]EER00131.1 hypothetical protein Pmar_PMAR014798 [Perkinsus marinus ATCC 50983]|eukprot:XP_002767413.1 hypothetical protein Pmar_PMAR014798 [Perkinsus marinus ATCC 50983]